MLYEEVHAGAQSSEEDLFPMAFGTVARSAISVWDSGWPVDLEEADEVGGYFHPGIGVG